MISASEWAYRIHCGLRLKLSRKELEDADSLHGESMKDEDDGTKFRYFKTGHAVGDWIKENGLCLEDDYPHQVRILFFFIYFFKISLMTLIKKNVFKFYRFQVKHKVFPKYDEFTGDLDFDLEADRFIFPPDVIDGSQLMNVILRQPAVVSVCVDLKKFSKHSKVSSFCKLFFK